jgi:hypothetical protein
MEPIVCPECGIDEWRCIENGRYDGWLYFRYGTFGDTLEAADHEEYDSARGVWECINGHKAPPELQHEIEERAMDAEYA